MLASHQEGRMRSFNFGFLLKILEKRKEKRKKKMHEKQKYFSYKRFLLRMYNLQCFN